MQGLRREIHTFDLVRTDDSNPNYKLDDPNKIHWGKFALMARMVTMLSGFQDKIRLTGAYEYPERKWLEELLDVPIMDEDVCHCSTGVVVQIFN